MCKVVWATSQAHARQCYSMLWAQGVTHRADRRRVDPVGQADRGGRRGRAAPFRLHRLGRADPAARVLDRRARPAARVARRSSGRARRACQSCHAPTCPAHLRAQPYSRLCTTTAECLVMPTRSRNGTLLSTVGMRCTEACDARGKRNMHKSCHVGLARVGLEYQACHVGLACQVCRRRELAWPASPRYPPHSRAAQAQPSPSRALAATRLASPRRERTSGCCMSEHGTGATALMGRTIITHARSEL